MWYRLGQNILKYKKTYLFFILLSTVVMGYYAVQVKLSYEYTKAIPSDNSKFIVYNEFIKKYGVDNPMKLNDIKDKVSEKLTSIKQDRTDEWQQNIITSKRKNGTLKSWVFTCMSSSHFQQTPRIFSPVGRS